MNSRLLSVFSAAAIALVASAPLSHAVVYTPTQFNAALKIAIGKKTGAKATTAAANLYKKALGDKKNKKNAVKYTTSILKALKKPVKSNLQGASRATLANALVNGYFKGLAYNASDSKFTAALRKLVSGLPGTQKNETIAKLITSTLLSYNTAKGGGTAGANTINGIVYPALGLPVPVIS